MRIIDAQMPAASTVTAGQTSVFNLPIGRTYHGLAIEYGGATLAQLNAFRIKLDGEVIMSLGSGNELDSRNKFDGRAAAGGVIFVNFERENLMTISNRMATAIGTGFKGKQAKGQTPREPSTLQLEIDVDAAAVAPTLTVTAQQSEPSPLGVVRYLREFNYSAPAGTFEVADLPKGGAQNAQLGRVWIVSANTTAVELRKNNRTIFERSKALNDAWQTDGKRVPQTGYFVYDPTENGLGGQSLDLSDANDLRFILTLSGAEAIKVLVEYLGVKG
jgi:hypothetical protein